MRRRPPRSTRTDTLVPYTTLFRSEVTAITDGEVRVHRANVVISGTGQLNSPKLPNIEGMDSFAGASMHSARWNHDVSLKGKRVEIIGTGASAYQIAPAIADEVGKLEVFQRSAPWLLTTADRSDERLVGQECVGTVRKRGSP